MEKHEITTEEIRSSLIGRMETVLKNAHSELRLKHKYKDVPLWSFVESMTNFGSGYSMEVCELFGWNPHQEARKPILPSKK